MKKLCKTLILSLLAIVTAFCFFACSSNNKSDTETWTYKVYSGDEYATLISYNGKDTTLSIPEKTENGMPVGRIKKGAFSGNSTIVSLTVPSSVEEIDGGALEKMKALETLNIPFVGRFFRSETTLNNNNVQEAKKAVDVERTFAFIFGKDSYDGGVKVTQSYNSASSEDYYLPEKLSVVYVSPKDSYGIPACAFFGNTLLNKIVINDKVVEIGEYAFKNCSVLNTFAVPASVAKIDAFAFSGCKALSDAKTVTVGEQTRSIGLTFVTEGATLKEIGNNAFEGNKLVNVVLPSSVEIIGNYAFASILSELEIEDASTIKEITLSSSIKEIGEYAFIKCENLEKVIIPNAVSDNSVTVKKGAFAYCISLDSFNADQEQVIDLIKVDSIGATSFGYLDNGKEYSVNNFSGGETALNSAFIGTNVKKPA